jgi:hypothetical protein
MSASASHLDQLESLVRSLRSANMQLERQLLTVSVEPDAAKRADLTRAIQTENEKIARENERSHLQLADEVRSAQRACNERRGAHCSATSSVRASSPALPSPADETSSCLAGRRGRAR